MYAVGVVHDYYNKEGWLTQMQPATHNIIDMPLYAVLY